ncbi:phage shock protein C (PspC) family protein [Homoserinimonas aerilata]|uniref:Phage shock protein C (PspC) family protein n=1 Tax=Homoserinimonas aerilata TaxID=1162970 RepID=A0A542YLA9_9MICO|nr:ATP-binding protein [Homoserinimonas aerilata]TQL48870.1 phage shock protein C (PspC) family protein [Homoserinimonas aerilata]
MSTALARPALERPRSAVIGGVGVALARHLGWPVRRVRFILVLASLFWGAGLLFYFWVWMLTPLEQAAVEAGSDADATPDARRKVPVAAILLSAGAVVTAIGVILANSGASTLTPVTFAIVLIGGAAAWSLAFDDADPLRSARYVVLVRGFAVLAFLLGGVLLLFSGGGRPDAVTAVLAIGMLVLGLGVALAPFVVKLWTELMAERAGRVREEQRAEIAAHLHDSVLQTLALIQNRAGASSDVGRLARAQERELRDWLFAGSNPVTVDLAQELRDVAAAIELEYPARIDVVVAGESVGASTALVGAAREAMLNAARHAGGEVSVYVESSASGVDVFVRDRGPGIDLDALPADRLGVRESIIGRMQRAGGTATVRPGAGGGTEVRLHLGEAGQ